MPLVTYSRVSVVGAGLYHSHLDKLKRQASAVGVGLVAVKNQLREGRDHFTGWSTRFGGLLIINKVVEAIDKSIFYLDNICSLLSQLCASIEILRSPTEAEFPQVPLPPSGTIDPERAAFFATLEARSAFAAYV